MMEALSPLVDLVFPPRCPLCGDGLAMQSGLCGSCWQELVLPSDPACKLCQRPFANANIGEGAICAPCLAAPPGHDGIAAATLYNDASRKLVLSFKHGSKIALAPMLARLMQARLPQLEGEWIFIPVPLHRRRIWRRGYNQSGLLARELARLTGQALLIDGLVRIRPTPSLGGLGSKARAKALAGAIRHNHIRKAQISGANIVLVDDVLTSGATSQACVHSLKKAGAGKVVIACFARVMNEALG